MKILLNLNLIESVEAGFDDGRILHLGAVGD